MPDDPIERIGVELEVYGIPQPAGSPPMTETYLHVRRRQDGAAERAVLGLPAYQGEQGPPGRPGAIHQGERTTAQLASLATVLTTDQTNWAYRNVDTNDQHVWTGKTFVVYHGVYATPGPTGPAPTMQPGTLTVAGKPVDPSKYGVRVTGNSGTYAVSLDLPELGKGDKGDVGPSGSVFTSVDVDQSSTKNDGDILTYRASTNKLTWTSSGYWTEEYVVPPSGFATVALKSTDTRYTILTANIPAKNYAYRFDFTGGADVSSSTGTQVDMEIRRDDATTGAIVGMGKGQDGDGYREVAFRAHSDVSINPDTRVGVIEPQTPVTLYVAAVKRVGLKAWSLRSDNAQLRIRLMRVK